MRNTQTDDLDQFFDNMDQELDELHYETAYSVQDLLQDLSPVQKNMPVKRGEHKGRLPDYARRKYVMSHDIDIASEHKLVIENTASKKSKNHPEGYPYGKLNVEDKGWVKHVYNFEYDYDRAEKTPPYRVYAQAINILKDDHKIKDDI